MRSVVYKKPLWRPQTNYSYPKSFAVKFTAVSQYMKKEPKCTQLRAIALLSIIFYSKTHNCQPIQTPLIILIILLIIFGNFIYFKQINIKYFQTKLVINLTSCMYFFFFWFQWPMLFFFLMNYSKVIVVSKISIKLYLFMNLMTKFYYLCLASIFN